MEVVIYYNPRCSKCNIALRCLTDNGIDPEKKYYLEDGVDMGELEDLVRLLGVEARGIMRTNEPEYNAMGLRDVTDDEKLLEAIVEEPKLLQRPIIVIDGERALIARGSKEEIGEFLNG